MHRWWIGAALAVSAAVVGVAGQVASVQPKLSVGDAAPAFSLPGTDGKTHRLSDYKGRTVVLAWFPVAFSGG